VDTESGRRASHGRLPTSPLDPTFLFFKELAVNVRKEYAPKSFDSLLGMEGFSDDLLTNHFTLYEGYVKNVNALLGKLDRLVEEGETSGPEYAEARRRLGWEWNGMRLHELYFENLSKEPVTPGKDDPLQKHLRSQFGSLDRWQKEFTATGAMRGIGWAMTYYDPVGDRLLNVWINEHDAGHLSTCIPIAVLDVFEHAYMLDYGVKKDGYLEAFMRHLNWSVVSGRLSGRGSLRRRSA
jgi:superoxide dismutase, Fe-Mn family